MRNLAGYSVLILVAYIAGAAQHFGTDGVLALVAPAVSGVTAAGDAIWSVVGQDLASHPILIPIVWLYLAIGAAWAFEAGGKHNRDLRDRHLSGVKGIWNKLPEVDGKRSIPVWAVFIIPIVAVAEFFARVCYFAGFTVVSLTLAPLRAVFTLDLSELFIKRHSLTGQQALSTHKCEVVRVFLEKHPNADQLSVVKVHGYEYAVRTQDWKDGDLAVCIPSNSVVPDTKLFEFLLGHRRIRVKNLRGRDSLGLLVHAPEGAREGDDYMEALGVKHCPC